MADKVFADDPFQLQVAIAMYRRKRDKTKNKLEKQYWEEQVQQAEAMLRKAQAPKEEPNGEQSD